VGGWFFLKSPRPTPAPPGSPAVELVAEGLSRPVYLTAAPGDRDRLFVLEQAGRIRLIREGSLLPDPFLNIEDLVVDLSGYDERGLLGLAFHPDYARNRYFFVNYVDGQNRTVIARYRTGSNPDRADRQSAETVLTIDQPYSNHNGGMLAFGPDGFLYVATGDGGSGGDPQGRAQDLTSLHGKLLRLDVDTLPYDTPPGNPFAGPGEPLDEIWAYGLRNPWRFSFDRQTGDLWIADVGQNRREEINFEPAGQGGRNYGWNIMEGRECFQPPANCDQSGLTLPVHEYDHDNGCSVTGGYVYRGAALSGLRGHYLFGDWCSGRIWSLRLRNGTAVDLTERTAQLVPGEGREIDQVASFGEDGAGELYIVDYDGEIYRIVAR
jgi:glucose/arabinose dehydrogenase